MEVQRLHESNFVNKYATANGTAKTLWATTNDSRGSCRISLPAATLAFDEVQGLAVSQISDPLDDSEMSASMEQLMPLLEKFTPALRVVVIL
eukprot:2326315-Prymnesium_polylepis.1